MSYNEACRKAVGVVRAAAALATHDTSFHASMHPAVDAELRAANDSLRQVGASMLALSGHHADFAWKRVASCVDVLFELVDAEFDQVGRVHTEEKELEKPQDALGMEIDNSDSRPFKPRLHSKPHALRPLAESLAVRELAHGPFYPNPYEFEILNQPYNELINTSAEPVAPKDWAATGATWVDSEPLLLAMLESLRAASEIAVDLEHHDYRTYYGLVCLMQILTRDQDWIVDTLVLRLRLHVLNEVFADPHITKVFHGAFMDVIWLQRDLGIYVVSLFDTYHASRSLGFPKHSLAYLLEHLAAFHTSKKYQLADWRVRPLPQAMEDYARSDTHFLLYIFDQLRNRLLAADKMREVLHNSRLVANRRFEYVKFRPSEQTPGELEVLLAKGNEAHWLASNNNVPKLRHHVVAHLVEWRDQVARLEDESPRFVLSTRALLNLAGMVAPSLAAVERMLGRRRLHAQRLVDIVMSAEPESRDSESSAAVAYVAPLPSAALPTSTALCCDAVFLAWAAAPPLVSFANGVREVEESDLAQRYDAVQAEFRKEADAVAKPEQPAEIEQPKTQQPAEEKVAKEELVTLVEPLIKTQPKEAPEETEVFDYNAATLPVVPEKRKLFKLFSDYKGPRTGKKARTSGRSYSYK